MEHDTTTSVAEGATPDVPTPAADVPAETADDQNPALIDAHKTFVITLISAALFIGAVFVFVL